MNLIFECSRRACEHFCKYNLMQILFLVGVVSSLPAPQSSVHVRFSSRPVSYSHGSVDISSSELVSTTFRTPDSVSRRSAVVHKVHRVVPGFHPRAAREFVHKESIVPNPELLWPNGVFLQPDDNMLALLADRSEHQDVYQGFVSVEEDPDPLLITGAEAVAMVKFIFSKGPLFYEDVPHARALMRNRQLRLANGLDGPLLGSIRPDSVFYRWKHLHGNHQQSYTMPLFTL